MAYWMEHSLAAAPQISGFGTANTADIKYILGDKPKVQFATEITELELMTGQIGAAPERLVGRRHGTLTFSQPLEAFKSGYDPTAEDPGDTGVVPPWMCMLGNVLGSNIALSNDAAKFWNGQHLSNSSYVASGMASGTPSTILTNANPTTVQAGQLALVALTATSTVPQIGFIKTLHTGTKTLTLWEDAKNDVNSNDGNLYGTSTAWICSNHSDQIPMTFLWQGENTAACYILQDAICTGAKITWEAGAVPTIEFTFNFYEFSVDKTKGGLTVPDAFQRVPQIVGANNGIVKLGKTSAGVFGTATQCGLESCSWDYKTEVVEVKCHAATQGISGVVYRKPRITVACSIPWDHNDEVRNAAGTAGNTGSHLWQSMLELGQTVSLGVYVGSKVGRVFGLHVPGGKIVAVPQVADVAQSTGYQLTIEAGSYTGDTTDHAVTALNSPLNAISKVALG